MPNVSGIASWTATDPSSATPETERAACFVAQVKRAERRRFLTIAFVRALIFAAAMGTWAYASGHWVDAHAVSDPVSVLRALADIIWSGRVWPDVWQTVYEVVAGYAIGAVCGVALALLFVVSLYFKRIVNPFVLAVYAIPKVALAPLIIMWFGLGTEPKIILAALFSFFVTFVNAVAGADSVDPQLARMLSVMGSTRLTLLTKLTIPSMVPFLFAGMRLALPEALIGAAIGEFISADLGLAHLVDEAASQLNMAVSFAAIFIMLILVMIGDWIIGSAENYFLHWRPKLRA